jgi:tetratricopeptide (TPR) repeat protein
MPDDEPEKTHRPGLTREQRRLLDTPRATPPPAAQPPATAKTERIDPPLTEEDSPPPSEKKSRRTEEEKRTPVAAAERLLVPKRKRLGRVLELQQAALILFSLVLLVLAFYLGRNFDRLKYLVLSRTNPPIEKQPDDYPAVSASDLVNQAIEAERSGDWHEAVKKLLAAKQKDLRYRGLLFRMGKLFFTHGDLKSADKAFERAILFQEDVGPSNEFRGLIATRDNDYTAAQHFFEEATRADPLVADYYYLWGESLRLGLQPKLAIPRYEEARVRARDEQDALVCRFKIRLAEMEAAESPKVEKELEEKKATGPLSVDWLMVEAALRIREGKMEAAANLINQARAGKTPGLFTSCASDMAFKDAARKHAELVEPLHLDLPQHATIR